VRVSPPVFPGQRGLQSPSAPWCLAAPSAPACSAHVMGLWVHPIPWPGLSPGFPRSALGVLTPQDPFRVAQPSPPIPRGMWIAVEPEAVPPERRVECGASQDFPPAPRFPGFPPWGGGPKGYLSGPGTTRVRVRPHSRATPRPGSSGLPKGTSLRARERPGTREIKGILFTIPRLPRYPTPQRRPPCPPCPAWRSA